MSYEARVIYDFDSVSSEELGVKEGDSVTVVDAGIGQGWVMARARDGREGVVPEAYLERAAEAGGDMRRASATPSGNSWGEDWDSDEEEHRYEDPKDIVSSSSFPAPPVAPGGGGASDDWGYTVPVASRPDSVSSNTASMSSRPSSVQTSTASGHKPAQISRPPPPPASQFGGNFLSSVLSGVKGNNVGEYLKGATEAGATHAKEAIQINDSNKDFFIWENSQAPYTCKMGAPKKGSKFGGLKGFVTYPITPDFSNIQVSRRYKQFDWLYERLCGKFGTVIAIPPLPDKQVTGRFEEDLIEHRRIELQSFIYRVCRHPVLANSEVWKHFITETDDRRWTEGKRKAEKDSLIGISFLTTIQAPSILSETESSIERSLGQFSGDMANLDTAVKALSSVAVDQAGKYKNSIKKDYQDIGKAFRQLSSAAVTTSASPSLDKIGVCYEEMAAMIEAQPAKDWEPLQHMMHDYKGMVSSWSNILGLYHNTEDKHKEIMREGNEKERDCSVSRINTYRVGVQSEKNFFTQELGVDLDYVSRVFMVKQMEYHREMYSKLEQVYHQCWPSEEQPQDGAGHTAPPAPSEPVDPLNAW